MCYIFFSMEQRVLYLRKYVYDENCYHQIRHLRPDVSHTVNGILLWSSVLTFLSGLA